ncbi:FecR domain-containing protein [Halosquirtibacter xylanolyticus]|uniref:FecR family protein n=1 Tax=Halosquirtibacter xylanolyticus TaxID=3374599 RepID=UPI00374A757E|nr:FecR domain-containing protein [Prolixibacteraceae bacterium]
MSEINSKIYNKLLMDHSFVCYAQGDLEHRQRWDEWIHKHPEYANEVEEAKCVAVSLRFVQTKSNAFSLQQKWEKLKQSIDNVSHQRLLRHLKLWRYAASILVLISLGFVSMYFKQRSEVNEYLTLSSLPIEVQTSTGAPSKVVLPDGTEVWINSSSKLRYPSVFSEKCREVHLEGEAFFHVTKNVTPFVVHAPRCDVKVYGTKFNVDAYPEEDKSVVALKEGSVSISGEEMKEYFLKPGMVAEIKDDQKVDINKVEHLQQYDDWKDGEISFKGRSLIDITDRLGRKFGVEFQYLNPEIGNYTYDLSVTTESLKEILELLEFTAPIKFEHDSVEDRKIIVRKK